jgi:quercetin dioxygenase-like cupin family protein
MGLAMELINWDSVTPEVMSDTIWRKIVTGEKVMLAHVFVKKGGLVPEHQHESEQLSYILEGALKFELEGRTVVVHKGEVLLIPSHVPHRAVALEDALSLDVFSPIRADWLAKDDAYLRGGKPEAAPQTPRL